MIKRKIKAIRDRILGQHGDHHTRVLAELRDPRVYGSFRWRLFLDQCFVPMVFFDIGANDPFSDEGQQTIFKPLMPDTRFFLFEAMAKHEPALKRSGEPYEVAVLDSDDGLEKTFYETRAFSPGTGDSLYLEQTAAYSGDCLVTTRHITRRLDTIVEERGWPLPDFMKLDTQGSELDILRGAPRCMANARGLQIECNVQEYNRGAPLLPEVIEFMRFHGFRLFDIAQFHFTAQKELLQVDAIFVRG